MSMDTRVFVARCDSYEQDIVDAAVARALDAFGGAAAIASPGQRVCVKPNLLMPRKPDGATTTHPSVVAAVCRQFIALGCMVEIADSCGGPYNAVVSKTLYKVTGMAEVAAQTGALLRYDSAATAMDITSAGKTRRYNIIQPLVDADVIIDIAKLKTHGLGHFTGAVKNMYGAVAGLQKAQGHAAHSTRQDFFTTMIDLYETVKPHFCLIDGIIGMEGNGPSGGDPKRANVLLAGVNGHCVDKLAVWLMHLDEKKVFTLTEAEQRDLLPKTVDELTLLGDDTTPLRTRFKPPAHDEKRSVLSLMLPKRLRDTLDNIKLPYPAIAEATCIGCGDCVRICPKNALHLKNKKAYLIQERCIRCYCCHEACPVKAIELTKKRRRRP